MQKIIIDVEDGVTMEDALAAVDVVGRSGRVSQSRGVTKFAHLSVVKIGGIRYEISSRDRKPPHYTDSFIVRLWEKR